MEIVLIIIMLLVSFSFVLKLTCQPFPGRLIVCAICAGSIILALDNALEQSRTQIADWLQNPDLMLDMAVFLTIDVFLQVAFCIVSTKKIAGETMTKMDKVVWCLTLWVPGILIFPTLFALLVEVVFSLPGVDFPTLAWTLSGIVFAVAMILPYGIRYIIPEEDLRLELIFMVNALIALLGVIVTVNGRTAVSGTNSVEWSSLIGILLILAVGALIGLLIYKHKTSKIYERNI